MKDTEVCRSIMLLLNEQAERYGLNVAGNLSAEYIYSAIPAPRPKINVNIDYLEQQDFIKTLSNHFEAAYMTAKGKALLMEPSEFNRRYPETITVTGTQNIVGANITVTDSFNVFEAIQRSSEFDAEAKELLLQILEILRSPQKSPTGLKALLAKLVDKSTDHALAAAIPALIKLLAKAF